MPAFILAGDGIPFHGIPAAVPELAAEQLPDGADMPLRPETRAMFMKARRGAARGRRTVVIDDTILPESFARPPAASPPTPTCGTAPTVPAEFGPAEYHSAADYLKAVGAPLFTSSIGTETTSGAWAACGSSIVGSTPIRTPSATYHGPRRAT